jgi:hypothetical protein
LSPPSHSAFRLIRRPDEENTGDDVLACFDAYRTARTLAELANTALAAASESVLMYQMLQGGRLAPLMLAVWALQALPAFDTDENRMWSQGACCVWSRGRRS